MKHGEKRLADACRTAIGGGIWILFLTGLMMTLAGCSQSIWNHGTDTIRKEEAVMEDGQQREDQLSEVTKEEASDVSSEQETDSSLEEEPDVPEDVISDKESRFIYVDVCGQVVHPGVYALPEGSRVYEAVELAGGFTDQAAPACINQADVLQDGQQIYVYSTDEAALQKTVYGAAGLSGTPAEQETSDGKVDLNHADKAQLMTLTGIGEARADAILAYRDQHGGFSSPEELMNVDGIKEKTYDKLKDEIMVTAS